MIIIIRNLYLIFPLLIKYVSVITMFFVNRWLRFYCNTDYNRITVNKLRVTGLFDCGFTSSDCFDVDTNYTRSFTWLKYSSFFLSR